MSHSKIQQAKIDDLPGIMEVFIACTSAMRKQGIDQWDYQYPEPATVLRDIQSGEVFIIKNTNRVLATITLTERQDRQYADIGWHYRNGKGIIMKRLAVHPLAQGEGLAKVLCRWAESTVADMGYDHIRLDAFSANPVSNHLYNDLGYEQANGLCYFHGNAVPFLCFEKKVT